MSEAKVRRFWDVEGVPVLEIEPATGGLDFCAVDDAEPRRFPVSSVTRNGGVVSEERFAELFPEAVPRIESALIASQTGL